MKYYGIFAFAFLVVVFFSSSQGLNTTYGAVGSYDRLLHREFVIEKSRFFRIVSRDVEYPPKGYRNQRVITAVRAIDKSKGRNGGYATLYRGGPGFRNMTLRLTSLRSQGLNFTIEVFGF